MADALETEGEGELIYHLKSSAAKYGLELEEFGVRARNLEVVSPEILMI